MKHHPRVRTFAQGVARGVSERGPAAWRDSFADTSSFFMASEGRLVFPSGDSATRGIEGLKRVIGLAMAAASYRWRFRDAHWSVLAPPR